jgi:hypothetical protein
MTTLSNFSRSNTEQRKEEERAFQTMVNDNMNPEYFDKKFNNDGRSSHLSPYSEYTSNRHISMNSEDLNNRLTALGSINQDFGRQIN